MTPIATGPHVQVDVRGDQVVAVRVDGAPASAPDHRAGPALLALAEQHPTGTVAWRQQDVAGVGDPAAWPTLLRHEHEVRSVACRHHDDPWLASVGAVDFDSALQGPAPNDRPFGTWLLSPDAGVTSAALLRVLGAPPEHLPFTAWLLVLGRRLLQAGAMGWSDPALLADPESSRVVHDARSTALAVRHGFGRRHLGPWALVGRTGFGPRLRAGTAALAAVARRHDQQPSGVVRWPAGGHQTPALGSPTEIDVVIPTLGRPEALDDVLADLARQTLLPTSVVVVEQGCPEDERRDLATRSWPFPLRHLHLDRLGAGNARNEGMALGRAPWIALLDDDLRFDDDLLAGLALRVGSTGSEAVTSALSGLEAGDRPIATMWPGFGSGTSLLARRLVDEVGGFDRRLDGGFGEDTELGVRLRGAGANVLLVHDPVVHHHKAPVGGMRAPFPHPWHDVGDAPRPSPTITLARRGWATPAMARGYRLHWWLDAMRQDRLRFRPWSRARGWRASQRWADHLERSDDPGLARALPHRERATTQGPPDR